MNILKWFGKKQKATSTIIHVGDYIATNNPSMIVYGETLEDRIENCRDMMNNLRRELYRLERIKAKGEGK
jgi:hypothetical protein